MDELLVWTHAGNTVLPCIAYIYETKTKTKKKISKKSNQLDDSHSYAHLLLVCNLFLIIEISICVQFKYLLNMTYLHWIARKVFVCVEWVRKEFVWLTTTHYVRIFFFFALPRSQFILWLHLSLVKLYIG